MYSIVEMTVQLVGAGHAKPLQPDALDSIVLGVSATALVVIGALGISGIVSMTVTGACFIGCSIAPLLISAARSQNGAAWSCFFVVFLPLAAGLGGAALAGRISVQAMSGISVGWGGVAGLVTATMFASIEDREGKRKTRFL